MTRLPEATLKLAIGTAISDKMKVDDVVVKLWRENPEQVRSLYSSIASRRINDVWRLSGYHRRLEERKKTPLPTRQKVGLTMSAIAKRTHIEAATLVNLMQHHGLLELAQYGLEQKRRLVTEAAYDAGVGHNVRPENRIGHLEGYNKAAPFPVFYEDRLKDILWMLDYPGIKRKVSKLKGKKAKLSWLLSHHAYLPDQEVASLAGYSRRAVISARKAMPSPVVLAA